MLEYRTNANSCHYVPVRTTTDCLNGNLHRVSQFHILFTCPIDRKSKSFFEPGQLTCASVAGSQTITYIFSDTMYIPVVAELWLPSHIPVDCVTFYRIPDVDRDSGAFMISPGLK